MTYHRPWNTKPFATLIGIAACLAAGCQVRNKLEPTERAVQPTVSAFECGGSSVKAAILSCREGGGHYGHCAVVASRQGVSDATACYTYASKIRKLREQLVGQEDQLDAQIRYLQDVNTDTAELNAQLNLKIQEVTARTDIAVDALGRGEMTKSELAQLRAILDEEVTSAQRQLDAASYALQASEQYRSQQGAPQAALDVEIARLEALLDQARRQKNSLVAQRQRVGGAT